MQHASTWEYFERVLLITDKGGRHFHILSSPPLLNESHHSTGSGPRTEKSERSGGGVDFDLIFHLNVYPTNFMSFFFDNLCRILGFGGTSPPVLPPLRRHWVYHFLE